MEASSGTVTVRENEERFLGFPPPVPLTGRKKPVPYFFVADEAFPLQENITKVFSGVYP